MGNRTGRRWPVAVLVTAGGLFLGAGGFGLFRAAHAEPVPAAPPQFRPAVGDPPTGTFDPAVTPALGIVPAAPPPPVIPAPAIPDRPGDVLPVPQLPVPAGPRAGAVEPIPMRASDLPQVPPPVEVLPAPLPVTTRDPAPPVPVVPLPAAPAAAPKPPTTKPAPVKEPAVRDVFPVPVEVPQPAPPAKSAGSPPLPPPVPPSLNLQPSQPRHNVKPVEPAPAVPPVTMEFPAAPTVELNAPAAGPGPRGSAAPGVPTARAVTASLSPGDAPMLLSFRQVTGVAVLGTALLAVPGFADEPKPTDTVKHEDLAPIKRQVEDLRRDVKELREALEGKSDKGSVTDGLLKTVRNLEATLNRLDQRLTGFETKLSDATRTAGSSPLAGGMTPGIVTRSTVKIVNEYPVEISMLVNGVPYRVAPNSTREVSVTSGTFKYQLLTSGGGEVSSPIKDAETVTLRVR